MKELSLETFPFAYSFAKLTRVFVDGSRRREEDYIINLSTVSCPWR